MDSIDVTAPQLFSMTESISNTAHRENYTLERRTSFGQAVKQEEIALGAPQDRNSIGFATEIVNYDLIATGSFNFNTTFAAYCSIMEGVVRAAKPASLYLSDSTVLKFMMTAGIETDLFVENSIHLDYVERHFGLPNDLEYTVVTHADARSGVFPQKFDISIIEAADASANPEMLEAVINNCADGGTVILGISLDQGNLVRLGEAHDFWPMFTDLAARDDVRVSHIPISLGLTLITKV